MQGARLSLLQMKLPDIDEDEDEASTTLPDEGASTIAASSSAPPVAKLAKVPEEQLSATTLDALVWDGAGKPDAVAVRCGSAAERTSPGRSIDCLLDSVFDHLYFS